MFDRKCFNHGSLRWCRILPKIEQSQNIFSYRRIFIKLLNNNLQFIFQIYIILLFYFFFFILSILLSWKTERYREPSRRIRENGKKRGWIVKKKKKHWKTSMTNKKARPGILRRHERTSRARKTREWLDATRWGREERTGCYLLAIFFHSFFLDLSLFLSLWRSLSSSPFQPNVHRERA